MSFFNFDNMSTVEFFFNSILIDPGIITNYEEFFVPYFWFLLHAIPCLGTIVIFNKDHHVMGINQILKYATKREYFFQNFYP